MEAPPPSYHSIVAKVESQLGSDPTPEKVLLVVSNLPLAEAHVISQATDEPTLTQAEKDAFNEGMRKYLATDAAKKRLETNADDATKACELIDTMFNNLAVKLGEVDAKNKGSKKFMPDFLTLRESYRSILQRSKETAINMAAYARRFDDKILRICLDKRIPVEKKQEKLQEFIDDATGFKTSSEGIIQGFESLKSSFGAFTGSFSAWADGEDKKLQDEVDKLNNEITALQEEINTIKGKMAKAGLIGGLVTVGATLLLTSLLGPIGLVAGLIGAGVTIGLMVSWTNEITLKDRQISEKKKRVKDLTSEKDAIIATRVQLVELGKHSFTTFAEQIGHLNEVWTYASNDAVKVKASLEEIKKDARDLSDDLLKEYVFNSIGHTSGLYSLMATYLERYADGIKAADARKQ